MRSDTDRPTITPEQARANRQASMTWHGLLAEDNIGHVFERIRNLLVGRYYTFVSANASIAWKAPDVRVSQRLAGREGLTLRLNTEPRRVSEPNQRSWSSINVHDTWIWWLTAHHATEAEARAYRAENPTSPRWTHVLIEGGRTPGELTRHARIEVEQVNGLGETLHWVIAPEQHYDEDCREVRIP